MRYEDLPADLRVMLEEDRMSMVKETDNVVVDVLLILKNGGETITPALEGYMVFRSPKPWYDFVSKPFSDDAVQCEQLVRDALGL